MNYNRYVPNLYKYEGGDTFTFYAFLIQTVHYETDFKYLNKEDSSEFIRAKQKKIDEFVSKANIQDILVARDKMLEDAKEALAKQG